MCGNFGILVKTRNNHADDFIRDAFTASMLRGVDSSGIGSIDMLLKQFAVHKLPVAGNFFAGDNVARSLIFDAGAANILSMCHVRAATVGRVSLSNAHPFEISDSDGDRTIIGTHNGTLTNWATKPSAKDYNVDSEWALSHIFNEGFDAFEDFTGAYSFVWWDSDNPDIVNFARNSERPMHVVFIEGGGLAYASEPGMLYWLLERNKIKMEGKILELDAGKHYKFSRLDVKDFASVQLPTPKQASSSYSSNYQQHRYNNSNTTYHMTTVQNVEKLLQDLAAKTTTPTVSAEEQAAAREFGWYEADVEFDPIMVTEKGMEGTAICGNGEFEALLRGDVDSFDPHHTWHCKVIGVIDDYVDVTLVLDKPYKTTPLVITPLSEIQ